MWEPVRLAAVEKEEPILKTLGRQGFRRRGHIARGDLRAPFCVNNLSMCSERWLVAGRVLKPHWLKRWLTGSQGGNWTRFPDPTASKRKENRVFVSLGCILPYLKLALSQSTRCKPKYENCFNQLSNMAHKCLLWNPKDHCLLLLPFLITTVKHHHHH
jgi:hypothetical protein